MTTGKAEQAEGRRQRRAGEIEEGELGAAPVLLDGIADEVVEEHAHHHPDHLVVLRDEQPRHQPPDLPVENGVGIEVQNGGGGVAGEGVQEEYRCGDENDVAHQPGDAEAGVGQTKAVDAVRELPQDQNLHKSRNVSQDAL